MRTWTETSAKASPYVKLFTDSEKKYGLPPTLLKRIAWIESRFNPNASNPSGAQGMMQIIPKWHPDVKNPYDPNEAIPYAAQYLKSLHKRYNNWPKAIAAYNWGLGNVDKVIKEYPNAWRDKLPKETKNYVAQVEAVLDVG
jgi:soluble lytic murein transglycosylase-like protein